MMDYFLLFLRNNWFFIVEIGLLVISILVAIFKKKAVITIPGSFISTLLKLIPGFIEEAEVVYGSGNGDKKLTYVIKKVVDLTCEQFRCTTSSLPSSFVPEIIDFVEGILSTPHKKEDTVDVQGKII